MCQNSIDIIRKIPADVTCGLCLIFDTCHLPLAIERRQKGADIFKPFTKERRINLAKEPFSISEQSQSPHD